MTERIGEEREREPERAESRCERVEQSNEMCGVCEAMGGRQKKAENAICAAGERRM